LVAGAAAAPGLKIEGWRVDRGTKLCLLDATDATEWYGSSHVLLHPFATVADANWSAG